MNTIAQNPGPVQPVVNDGSGLGFIGWTVVAWTMAGGLLLGGFYIAFLTLSGHLTAGGILPIMGIFFLAGSLLGLVHGGIFAFLGRPLEVSRRVAAFRLLRGLAAAVVGLVVAWVITLWIAMTAYVLTSGPRLVLPGVVLGWIVGAVICYWAFIQAVHAARNLYVHWPDGRIGMPLIAVTMAVLLAAFIQIRPEIWATDIRVTRLGAAVLAIGATIWMASPVIYVGLRILHHEKKGDHREVSMQ